MHRKSHDCKAVTWGQPPPDEPRLGWDRRGVNPAKLAGGERGWGGSWPWLRGSARKEKWSSSPCQPGSPAAWRSYALNRALLHCHVRQHLRGWTLAGAPVPIPPTRCILFSTGKLRHLSHERSACLHARFTPQRLCGWCGQHHREPLNSRSGVQLDLVRPKRKTSAY